MAEIVIRPTEPDDVNLLIENLRKSDRAECEAYGSPEIATEIRLSVLSSYLCWSAFADGELGCIIGVSPISMLGGVGSPWMLGTPVLDKHRRVLVRLAPGYIATMLESFPHLMNFVHAKNTSSIRWLKALGFAIHPALPYRRLGEMFHPFEKKA